MEINLYLPPPNMCKDCGEEYPFLENDKPADYRGPLSSYLFKVVCPRCGNKSKEWLPQREAILEWNNNNPIKVKELAGGELIMESDNEYKVKGDREITNGERKVGEVIHQAMLRCFSGKGKERHNIEGTVDFMDQPLMEISRRVGIGGPLYQVHKKAYEAHDMVRKGDKDRARNELLDIIIYTAATVLLLDEQKEDK